MPTFRCLSRLLWIVPLALGLANCAVMDEALVPNNAAILSPHTTAQETTLEPPRAVAINHFKRTKQLLTDRQQALVKEVYSAISQQPQDINMMRLTSSVNAIQTYISSTAPAVIPSMLLLALGDGFFQLQQTNDAVSAWQRSVSANQYNYFAHDRLAQAHRQRGEFVVAEQHYNEAINAWSDFSSGYRNRGILYDLYLGDKARALDDYRQYRQLLTLAGQQTREVDRWIKEMQVAVKMSSR